VHETDLIRGVQEQARHVHVQDAQQLGPDGVGCEGGGGEARGGGGQVAEEAAEEDDAFLAVDRAYALWWWRWRWRWWGRRGTRGGRGRECERIRHEALAYSRDKVRVTGRWSVTFFAVRLEIGV